jgi:hypothetical protein
MLVRTTWASHPRSRDGANPGDGGTGTSRTIVRFILGQSSKDSDRVKLEMERKFAFKLAAFDAPLIFYKLFHSI